MMESIFAVSLSELFGLKDNASRKVKNEKIAFAKALIFAQDQRQKQNMQNLQEGIGQSLMTIQEQLGKNLQSSLENQDMIAIMLQEVQAITRVLQPIQIEKLGLTAAIEEAILKFGRSSKLFVSTDVDNIDNVFSERAQFDIFRTIKEALSNVDKHAEASAINIEIKNMDKQIAIDIQDNGKGFDYELAVVTTKSLGIRTMFESINDLGGILNFRNGNSNGTIINITIPK